MSKDTSPHFDIAICGGGAVGKSSVTIQFVKSQFSEGDYDPTIEETYNKVIKVDDKTVRLYLIDTAGQEEYAPLRDSYMRKAHGFILVYDVTNQKTLAELDDYHNQILRIKDNNPFGCVIFGNKCDLDKGKNGVKTEEGKNVAKAYKAEFFEGSAKLKKNIDEAFEACARQILEKFTKKTPSIEEKKKSSGSFIFKSLNDHNDTEIKF